MDETEPLMDTSELEGAETFFTTSQETEIHVHELEPDAEVHGAAAEKSELQIPDGADASKEAVAFAIGGKAEHWEEVGSGSGQWVFDGEKIFNPSTREEYGSLDPEKAEVVQEEAVRQWNEGGSPHVVIPGHREETADGVIVHSFQLILGDKREDGMTEVNWAWHKTELSNLAEETGKIEDDESGAGAQHFALQYEAERPEPTEQEYAGVAESVLEHAHEVVVGLPQSVDAGIPIALDTEHANATPEATAELADASAVVLDAPVLASIEKEGSAAPTEPLMHVIDRDAPSSADAPMGSVQPPIAVEAVTPVVIQENIPAAAPEATLLAETVPETTVEHTPETGPYLPIAEASSDSVPDSLPVFVPAEASQTAESVQTMYEALILAFEKKAAVTAVPQAEVASASQPTDRDHDVAVRPIPDREPVTNTPIEKPTDQKLEAVQAVVQRSEIRIPGPMIEQSPTARYIDRELSTTPSEVRSALPHEPTPVLEYRFSPASAEIASRILGVRFEPGERIMVHAGVRATPQDSIEDERPASHAFSAPEMHGIRMISARH